MICDTLENASAYPFGPAFQKAVEWVKKITVDTPNGRYGIDGDEIYATVMEYETGEEAPSKYEVHRRYADLQVLIAGHETLFVRTAKGLAVHTPYNPEKDCEFLAAGSWNDGVNLQLFPGCFAFLLPQDAHMGKGVTCLGKNKVQKVVVKIALELLQS